MALQVYLQHAPKSNLSLKQVKRLSCLGPNGTVGIITVGDKDYNCVEGVAKDATTALTTVIANYQKDGYCGNVHTITAFIAGIKENGGRVTSRKNELLSFDKFLLWT